MTQVLMISKPVVPPWNDSSKNLVRDLACAMERHVPVVMQPRGVSHPLGRATLSPVYAAERGRFAPAAAEQARVLARLLGSRDEPLWHFFFAPNLKTSAVGRLASRLRGRRTVHTVCSAPLDGVDLESVLFADRTVVLSRHTEARFLAAGVPSARLVRIPPCVPPLALPTSAERTAARARFGLPAGAVAVTYAGDLEMGGGAERVVDAVLEAGRQDVVLVMACRRKTAHAGAAEAALRARVEAACASPRVRWVGETGDILALLGASDVVVLPSTDLYAKMDYPLVVLEAMALGRPVVVAAGTPAAELADAGGVLAVDARSSAMVELVHRLADDAAEREALGGRARAVALEGFGPRAMAEAYESLYDQLAG